MSKGARTVGSTNTYTRRRNKLFDILDEAITDAIVERGIRLEPVNMSEQFNTEPAVRVI